MPAASPLCSCPGESSPYLCLAGRTQLCNTVKEALRGRLQREATDLGGVAPPRDHVLEKVQCASPQRA